MGQDLAPTPLLPAFAMAPFVGLVSNLVFLLLTSHVVSVPSPHSIGSDLSILTHNDLYGLYIDYRVVALSLFLQATRALDKPQPSS